MLTSSAEPLTLGNGWALGVAAGGVNRRPPAAQANTGLHKHSSSPFSPLASSCCRGMPGLLEWGGHTVGAPWGHAVLASVSSSHPVHSPPHPSLLRVTTPWQRTECSCLMPRHQPEQS